MFEYSVFKGKIIIISSIKMIKSCIICLALASKLVVGITLVFGITLLQRLAIFKQKRCCMRGFEMHLTETSVFR